MRIPRTFLAAAGLMALALGGGVAGQTPAATTTANPGAQPEPEVLKMADDLASGRPVARDFALSWTRVDAMKAQGGKQLMAFTVTLDTAPVAGRPLTLFYRVTPRAAAAGTPVYQSASAVPVAATGVSALRVTRGFLAAAGEYDVVVVVREAVSGAGVAALKAAALSQSVTVPDFWNGELATSSIILTERVTQTPAPAARQLPLEHPYAMGALELVPAWQAAFGRTAELSPFFLIYNAALDTAKKPDILIEYRFFSGRDGVTLFNVGQPQQLNARSLPPQFDATTYQLQGGQSFPLASFPEGRYRLDIKITDRIANRAIVRDIPFSITQ